MKFAFSIVFAMALFAASSATAETLRLVSVTESIVVAVDTDSLRFNGDRRTFWMTMITVEQRAANIAYKKVRYETDCARETVTILAVAAYNSDGQSIESNFTRQSTDPVIPGTVGDDIFRAACTETWLDEPPGMSVEFFVQVANDFFENTE